MNKFKSILKKGVSIIDNGIEPYEAGKYNFENPSLHFEQLAKKRTFVCISCPMFIDEPVDFLQVEDKRIPELSKKMCNDCGCTLSYKLRQDLKKCIKWQEQ